jgi:magnesium-transporting ATPase (P-type)
MGKINLFGHLTSAAIAVFLWALSTEELHSAAQTLAFSTLSLAQTWHVLNYSSTLKRIFGKSNAINKPLIGAIVLSLGLLVITMYTMPLSDILELYPLNLIVGYCYCNICYFHHSRFDHNAHTWIKEMKRGANLMFREI